jgi:Zn-dependent protease/predicted transcriptional regulator
MRNGENALAIFYTITFVLCVFVCVTLHELGHALMAKWLHYRTKDITLLPIGGMARMDEFPENPRHELAVAFAGPFVNLIIALLLYPLFYWLKNIPAFFTTLSITGDSFLFNLILVNIGLAVFNLLPAFPMDGGRIFRAFLSLKINRVKATAIAAGTGQVLAALFFLTGIFYNPVLAFIGIFIFFMAQTENEYVKSKFLLHDYKVEDIMMRKYYSLDSTDTIRDAARALLDVQASSFLIMENGNVIGTLDRDGIIRALTKNGEDSSVKFGMNTQVKFLEPEMPLEKAHMYLQSNSILPVVDKGQVIGVIDLNNILELIMIRSATGSNKNSHLIPDSKTRPTEIITH